MSKPSLIQIGNRIINVSAIRYIEIEGPQVVNVYMLEEERPMQFIGADGDALLVALDTGYVYKLNPSPSACDQAFGELVKELERTQ